MYLIRERVRESYSKRFSFIKRALYTRERALHILNPMRTPTGSMHLIRKRVLKSYSSALSSKKEPSTPAPKPYMC